MTNKGLTVFGNNSNKFPIIKLIHLVSNWMLIAGIIAFANSIHSFDKL